jgi:hypothetical protein
MGDKAKTLGKETRGAKAPPKRNKQRFCRTWKGGERVRRGCRGREGGEGGNLRDRKDEKQPSSTLSEGVHPLPLLSPCRNEIIQK